LNDEMNISIDTLLDAYNELEKKLSRQRVRALAKHLRDNDLTLNQYSILVIIYNRGASLANYLAQQLKLKAASITYLVDSLEKRKLITRTKNPQDRRSHFIQLTEEGKKLTSYHRDQTLLREDFKQMDQSEIEMLYIMIRLLYRKINA